MDPTQDDATAAAAVPAVPAVPANPATEAPSETPTQAVTYTKLDLFRAAKSGDTILFRTIVDSGCINSLWTLSTKEQVDVFFWLLEKGASSAAKVFANTLMLGAEVNEWVHFGTKRGALWYAVEEGDLGFMDWLKSLGGLDKCPPFPPPKEEADPATAWMSDYPAIMGLPKAVGPPPTKAKREDRDDLVTFSPLHLAASKNFSEGVSWILGCRDDWLSYEDSKGVTPLEVALKEGHEDTARLLLKHVQNSVIASQIRSEHLPTLFRAGEGLSNVTSLDLSSAPLNVNGSGGLPPEIGRLIQLKSLSLDGCGLHELPLEFGKLTNLTHLSLEGNALSDLTPGLFTPFVQLESLNLSLNPMTKLPVDVVSIPSLTKLDLFLLEVNWNDARNNVIDRVSESIRSLFFGSRNKYSKLVNCSLSSLPNSIVRLTNLQSLNVAYHHCSDPSAAFSPSLSALTYLDLMCNPSLSWISPKVSSCPNLHLNLHVNPSLSFLPSSMKSMSRLPTVDLTWSSPLLIPSDKWDARSLPPSSVKGYLESPISSNDENTSVFTCDSCSKPIFTANERFVCRLSWTHHSDANRSVPFLSRLCVNCGIQSASEAISSMGGNPELAFQEAISDGIDDFVSRALSAKGDPSIDMDLGSSDVTSLDGAPKPPPTFSIRKHSPDLKFLPGLPAYSRE